MPGQLGADFKFYQVAGFISLTQNLIVFAMWWFLCGKTIQRTCKKVKILREHFISTRL